MRGPMVDLTLGLIEGLDATFIGAPVFAVDSGSADQTESIEAGFKWRGLATDSWRACFSPALGVVFEDGSDLSVLLPAQVEYFSERWTIGVGGRTSMPRRCAGLVAFKNASTPIAPTTPMRNPCLSRIV